MAHRDDLTVINFPVHPWSHRSQSSDVGGPSASLRASDGYGPDGCRSIEKRRAIDR